MKRLIRTLCLVLAAALLLGCVPMSVFAVTTAEDVELRSLSEHIAQARASAQGYHQAFRTETDPGDLPLSEYPTDYNAVAAQLREAMKQRQEQVTLYICTTEWDYFTALDEVGDLATAHNGNPTEGDYLAWSLLQFDSSAESYSIGSDYYHKIDLELIYFGDLEMEQETDAAVETLLNETLPIDDSMTDYQKLRIVYDWVCANIYYDETHDDWYWPMYTAHAAVVEREAVCQGYALLLYRLLLELGIDNRFIGGYSDDGMGHAWNIVELDGVYYNVDATWDATWAQEGLEYEWFLLDEASFPDHNRDPEYVTEEFYAAYPMADAPYLATETNAYSGQCGDDLTWTLDEEGILTISGTGPMWDYPSHFPTWYDYEAEITGVVIEEGVTTVGDYAFYEHSALEWVEVAGTVTALGQGCFRLCIWLDEIYFLGDAPAFADNVFSEDFLTCYYPGDNPTWTEDVLLDYEADDIDWIPMGDEIPDEDWPIGGQCGDDLTWTLDETGLLTISGTGDMWDYTVDYPSWEMYEDEILEVYIEEGVTSVGPYAFFSCGSLYGATIMSSVTEVGDCAFAECTEMTLVMFVGDAPVMGEDVFRNCELCIVYPGHNDTWTEDLLQNYGASDIVWVPTDWPDRLEGWPLIGRCGDDLTWTLTEEGLLTISGTGGMWDYENAIPGWYWYTDAMTEAVVEEGVTSITTYALSECYLMHTVTLPESLVEIGDYAFEYSGLTAVTIPAGVERIGAGAFWGCGELTEIHFQGGAPEIGEDAFCYVEADCYVDATWTEDAMLSYGGTVNWVQAEQSGMPGDVNGSGTVDSDDAVYLLYHTLFGDGLYPVSGDGDCNGDGEVNSDDAVYLLYHTLFGDGLYPLK